MSFSNTRITSAARLLALGAAALAAMTPELVAAAPSAAAVKRGDSGADTLIGTARADKLFGRGGNDSLSGKGGADTLEGSSGEDKLSGGPGADTMRGGPAGDVLLARDGTADLVVCGPGPGDVAVVDAIDTIGGGCEAVEEPQRESPATPAGPTIINQPQPPSEPPPEEFEEQPLAMFPPEHGWTGNGVGSFEDVGAPFVVNNERSYKITSDGLTNASVATSPPLAPVDLTHSHVSFQAQISFSSRLGTVKLRLASGDIETDYAEATLWEADHDPIILGSTFEFQSLPIGAFDVVGDVDWSEIDRAQIVLTDNGLGPTILYVAGIYAVPTQQQALISFAFDDGYASTVTRGLKKLSGYRYPATAYVIAGIIGDAGRLTLEQLYNLRDKHHWEIAGHSMTLPAHNLPNGLDSLEPEALKTEMNALRDWLDEAGFERQTFAYPKGAAGQEVRHFVARDYCVGRSTARGPETIPARDHFTLRGWSINSAADDADSVKAEIDRAVAEQTWLMLSWHDIVGGTAGLPTEFSDDEFDEVVDYVRQLQLDGKLKVRTVADALDAHC